MGRKLKLGFVLLAASSLAVAQSTTPPAKPAGAAQVAQAPAAGGAATGAGGGSVAVAGTATGVSVGRHDKHHHAQPLIQPFVEG